MNYHIFGNPISFEINIEHISRGSEKLMRNN